ncbi:octopamine receptor 1-like [Exaiptasia diaphana]|uniref:G-protein coupled receptors family 1 profile domain-containing protein n=1 Tax=Exaiptasia diaphana TaxID=2652724 RepID=A0A913WRF5_EXADI|nr:octopamine receptor 1-like [Exaiptasia diaphana]XP_020892992.1 octopamine receptor 1-like [Exaiptasia diaphana]XP_020892993.1 octopamine receptor 1-like [Exaiptasia diaphana]XP_020892995.1 octopamine receptor 1-like [Exaiptasia diaphana]
MANKTNLSTSAHNLKEDNGLSFIALSTSWAVLGLISATLNLLVCFAVYRIKKLRTITNYFIVSLSAADLLVGIVFTPTYIIDHYAKTIIAGYLIAFILFASIFNLAAVTFERFIALTRPFQYRSLMNTRHVGIIISIAWISPLIICLLPLAWNTDNTATIHAVYKVILVVLILLPILVMICIYAKLLGVVRSFILRNKSRASAGNKTGNRVGREEKAAQVFASVFGTFLICWGPIIYINICEVADAGRTFVPEELIYVSFYTLQFNSIVDPIIYAFFKRDFIKARSQRHYCCCGVEKQEDISSEVILQRVSSHRNSLVSRNTKPCK